MTESCHSATPLCDAYTEFNLFKKTFVVLHHKLRFELFIELHRNRHDNQYTRCGEYGQKGQVGNSYARKYHRQYRGNERDERKVNRAEQSNSVGNLFEIVRSGSAGADTLNEAAVLLNGLGNVFGIELHRLIEERERENQKTQRYHIYELSVPEGGRAREPILNSFLRGIIRRAEHTYNHVGEGDERERED